jgi:hypothetical protein
VEDRNECCASERLDNSELRRRRVCGGFEVFGDGGWPSANVEARLSILFRSAAGIWPPEVSAGARSMLV